MTTCFTRYVVVCVIAVSVSAAFGGGKKKPKSKMNKVESELLMLINAERKKKNLKPLKPNQKLFAAARGHSKNMAKQQKLLHTLDGKTAFQRIKDAGYRYRYAGENIGFGKAPLTAVMKVWMQSKLHRENIMNPRFTEVGLGVAYTENGVPYYTQVFARPLR